LADELHTLITTFLPTRPFGNPSSDTHSSQRIGEGEMATAYAQVER